MNQAQVLPLPLEPPDRGASGVGAAVVDDSENDAGGRVRLAHHHLFDEPTERTDAFPLVDAVGQVQVVDVLGGEVSEQSVAAAVKPEPGRRAHVGFSTPPGVDGRPPHRTV
jgi:hypothetical protein